MKAKRNVTLGAVVGLMALFFTTGWTVVAGIEDNDVLHPYGSAGVWTFREPLGPEGQEGMLGLDIISPEENGKSLCVLKVANADPTIFGMFPDATTRTDFNGQRVRTGPNTWDYTYVGYGTAGAHEPGFGEIVWIMVFTGTMTVTDSGTTLKIPGHAKIYSGREDPDFVFPWGGEPLALHDQDTNPRDGFPDADEEPIFETDFEVTETRLPMLPPEAPQGE